MVLYVIYYYSGVLKDKDEVSDELFAKLSCLIEENETYVVDVLEIAESSSTIRIPSVYKQIANLL